MIKNAGLIFIWLLLVIMAARFVPNWHMQQSYDDLITDEAQKVLQQQDGLRIEVFASPHSPAAALVKNFLSPLATHLQGLIIEYIDIESNPELVVSYGITKQGEMVIHQAEQKFHLSTLSYEAFFNGLKKLNQTAEGWIVMLDQIEGRAFDRGNSTGLFQWLNELKKANYRTVVLPMQPNLKLPDDVKLIVLASPFKTFKSEELTWLQQQVDKGISVLWLADPSSALNQPGLSLLFDVMRTDAYHQGHLIIKDYNNHSINQSFDRPLDLVEVMSYISSDEVLWENLQGETLASTREMSASRLMVIGDSDFLSDAHLKSGGNMEMSFRLVDWLLFNDSRIDLPSIGTKGTQIHYDKNEILFFAGLMLIVIPLSLLLIAGYLWKKTKMNQG